MAYFEYTNCTECGKDDNCYLLHNVYPLCQKCWDWMHSPAW